MNILIVDGNNIAFRSFIALSTLNRGDNKTGCIYGFLTSLKKVVSQRKYSKVIVCWDRGRSRYRLKHYPDYKANRDKMSTPDFSDYRWQLGAIRKALDYLSVPQIFIKGIEADDLISLLTNHYKKSHKVFIYSSDQDMNQLLSKRVTIIKPTRQGLKLFRLIDFKREYNITPKQWVDVRAIMGDPGDNIIGIEGLGLKRSQAIVEFFGKMNHRLKKEITTIALSFGSRAPNIEKLVLSFDRVLKNKKLIRLPCKITCSFFTKEEQTRLELEMKLMDNPMQRGVNKKEFTRFCTRFRFSSFVLNIESWVKVFDLTI